MLPTPIHPQVESVFYHTDICNTLFLELSVKISTAIFKGDRFSTPGAGDEMSERRQQPIFLDPFGGTELIPVECQTTFALPETVGIDDVVCPKGSNGIKVLFRFIVQDHGVI